VTRQNVARGASGRLGTTIAYIMPSREGGFVEVARDNATGQAVFLGERSASPIRQGKEQVRSILGPRSSRERLDISRL